MFANQNGASAIASGNARHLFDVETLATASPIKPFFQDADGQVTAR
jgi:hypothetical protein